MQCVLILLSVTEHLSHHIPSLPEPPRSLTSVSEWNEHHYPGFSAVLLHSDNAGVFARAVSSLYFERCSQRTVDIDVLSGGNHMIWRNLSEITFTNRDITSQHLDWDKQQPPANTHKTGSHPTQVFRDRCKDAFVTEDHVNLYSGTHLISFCLDVLWTRQNKWRESKLKTLNVWRTFITNAVKTV